MKDLGSAFLRGLGVVLPVGLTLYFVYFLAVTAEQLVGGLIRWFVPDNWYWPGIGLMFSVIVLTCIGYLVRVPGLGFILSVTDWVFSNIPLVKSVYATLKDFTSFLSSAKGTDDNGKPVLVSLGPDARLVGLVTNSSTEIIGGDPDHVLVYLPMSYQIGGYTVLMHKDKLQELDMSLEEAMSFVVTAGVKNRGKK